MSHGTVSLRKWLILPIETKVREFDAKMLLAYHAAERGWGVVVGSKQATRHAQHQLPKGVIIEKSIATRGLESGTTFIDLAERAGNRVAAWCEEGLVYHDGEEYVRRRIDPRSLSRIDYFFTWGKNQADDIARFAGFPEKLVNSGNPRIDVLRPEWRGAFDSAAAQIRSRYGRIILINTNFKVGSHVRPGINDLIGFLRASGKITEATEPMWRRYEALEKKNFASFRSLLPVLSRAFPSHTIVVRTHPSESDAPWKETAKSLSNVKVVFEGNVVEWILAADAAISNNCMTGVEAYLLDKPSIAYRPHRDDGAEFAITHSLGFQCEQETELLSLLRRIVDGSIDVEATYAGQLHLAEHYLANVRGKSACENIVDTLDTLPLRAAAADFTPTIGSVADGVTSFFRSLTERLDRRMAYARKKFPGIERAEAQELLRSFQRVSGRFGSIRIRKISRDGFCVYAP